MKKLSTLLASIVFLGGVGQAQALPLTFTFQGTVTSIDNQFGSDITGAIANAGLGLGSAVNYTIIVDFLADGTYTQNNGTVITDSDDALYDYFYADFVSGDTINEVNGGYYNGPTDDAEYNEGINLLQVSKYNWWGLILVNSEDNFLEFTSSKVVSDWVEGDVINVANWAYNDIGYYSTLGAEVTLIDIGGQTAAPEPSILALMCVGLIGLGFVRCKNKKAQCP